MLGKEILQHIQRRWHVLPHNLQIREYHSPERLTKALERTPLYKRTMLRMKIMWIKLKLNPPFLLGLQQGRYEEEEKREWTMRDECKSLPTRGNIA